VTLVIDASVAVKWVLPENGSEEASSLLFEELMLPLFGCLKQPVSFGVGGDREKCPLIKQARVSLS
jgi:hypothetical protein